jgi:hypothetical protein
MVVMAVSLFYARSISKQDLLMEEMGVPAGTYTSKLCVERPPCTSWREEVYKELAEVEMDKGKLVEENEETMWSSRYQSEQSCVRLSA